MNERMPVDRTVKGLLALIAIALWGLLLRPLFHLPTAQAAPLIPPAASVPAIAIAPNYDDALVVQNGVVYKVSYSGGLAVSDKLTLK